MLNLYLENDLIFLTYNKCAAEYCNGKSLLKEDFIATIEYIVAKWKNSYFATMFSIIKISLIVILHNFATMFSMLSAADLFVNGKGLNY